ncbi:MAG: diguanylate cyclase [Chloroflexi bacterium]|nr:diguanylate cyclase [Chloroflexota bacterium]
MMPDIKTLMLLYIIVNVISAGAVAIIWSQNRGRFAGIIFWLVDMILQVVGSTLIVMRGVVPDIVSMTLSNTLVMAGIVIILIGFERFTGKKGLQIHNYFLLAVFIAVSTYFVVVHPDLRVREIALSATTMIFTFQCCWLLLRRVDSGMRQVTNLTGIVFACYAAFSLARIILTVIIPEQSSDFFKAGLVDALAITVYIVLSVCLAISLVLMVNRRLLADVRAQEEKYRNILENMQDSYIEVDLAGNFTFVNEAACRNLGYSMDELIGRSFSIIAPDQEETNAIFNAYSDVYKTGEPHTGFAFKIIRKDGSTGYAETSISLIKTEQGRSIGFRSVGRDVTERKQMEQKLLEMATHDALTGLPNRTLLYDRCSVALANVQRYNKKLAIMTLDLDLFKNINDTLGHDIGDRLLMAAAGRLTGALRKSDTVARMGGDEFVLLLGEVDDKLDAVNVADKILGDFRQPFLIDGHSLNVTVSIGIAIYPDNGDDIEDLLKNSDRLLYNAKQNGRDRFAI